MFKEEADILSIIWELFMYKLPWFAIVEALVAWFATKVVLSIVK